MITRLTLLSSVLLFAASSAKAEVRIAILSGRADMVSGGSALIEIEGMDQASRIMAGARDVTAAFHAAAATGGAIGLVEGLPLGKTELTVEQQGKQKASLLLTNYAIVGPIFSGPHQQPFACQPEVVKMGPRLDADCSLPTTITYWYRSTLPPTADGGPVTVPASTTRFRRYDPTAPRPADMSQTTTTDGQTMDFIVRREVGTINRGIYSIAFLYRPGQSMPTPWTSRTELPSWNGSLVYSFQGGCNPGYRQGSIPPPLTEAVLAQGFAEAGSTLSTFGNNCNDVLSAETMMMVKEHFIKTYGVPVHTLGSGGSGGTMQQLLIAQNYPGLIDGLSTLSLFPDTFSILPGVVDCSLLDRFFASYGTAWTPAQRTAVTGYSTPAVCESWASAHFAPGWVQARWCFDVPGSAIYDPVKNPKGVRCDLYDNEVSILGRDPATGYAQRLLDNVGVQYGLKAFNSGVIDAQQFLYLNQRIGGFDGDGNIVGTRSTANLAALRTAYETGRIERGGGSLGAVPIIDNRDYRDDPGNLHDKFRTYELQARLRAANGDAGNLIVFTQPPRTVSNLALLKQWLDNIVADTSAATPAAKVRHDKPAGLVDACWTKQGEKIDEPSTYDGTGRCNQLYPAHSDPRMAAGAPLAGTTLKCALKPVDAADYIHPLSGEQLSKLKKIFPLGVCDYSRPGPGEEIPSATWRVYPSK